VSELVLIRHGQSTWNAENRFTGWVDVPLSELGRKEAQDAGERLAAEGLRVGRAFTSSLRRAIDTGAIVLAALGQGSLEQTRAWQLNERFYGTLTGCNKDEARRAFGAAQVHAWRRGYDVPLPGGENLKEAAQRVLPYFEAHVLPATRRHDVVLVTAHGNSLRAIIKRLDRLDDAAIEAVEVPTGKPIRYTLADGRPPAKRLPW
jgi:2,3-bisphosphoglycerate-dependent phosphoglycerate mutase